MNTESSHSDASFFREVTEDVRKEKLKNLWNRFGLLLLGAVFVCVLLGVAVSVILHQRRMHFAASGEALSRALEQASQGKAKEALEELKKLENSAPSVYVALARIRSASLLALLGKTQEAIAVFDKIAKDNSVDAELRHLARLRSIFLVVDTGSYAEVRRRVAEFSGVKTPPAALALEALGLSAWREEKMSDAHDIFRGLVEDTSASASIQKRSAIMLELICRSGRFSCEPA